MISKKMDGYEVILKQADIANLPEADAIVNAANSLLTIGGGVAGAIHRTAGADLERESRKYAPIKPGEAVITGAYKLPNKYVIHTLGPIYGKDKPADELLGNCYRNVLRIADEHQIHTIAFPAISTGAFGYPLEAAAEVVFEIVPAVMKELQYPKKIMFVLFSNSDFSHYSNMIKRL